MYKLPANTNQFGDTAATADFIEIRYFYYNVSKDLANENVWQLGKVESQRRVYAIARKTTK